MPAQSGALLKQDLSLILTTDNKPLISTTYPEDNSKWIGLYPKLMIETQSPVTTGYLIFNNETIKGKSLDPYHLEFLLHKVLDPETVYQAVFQVEAASGELSTPKTINFTTVRIETGRVWIEVFANNKSKVNVFKGKKLLKTMRCSIGDINHQVPLGTYYTHDTGDSFVDAKNSEGANFYIRVSSACAFQGLIRDAYWNIKPQFLNHFGEPVKRSNIILKDEDARWLYENTSPGTMVILHK